MDEQKHFDECRDVICQNIAYYQERTAQMKRETESLYAAVTSGNVELYDQLIVSVDLKEHQERQLKKNQAAYQKPYFGRIDYLETETGQSERLYIGKNGISKDRIDVLIVDWRAPVSTLYYENELGPGRYQVPGSDSVSVDLTLKRTFDIDGGTLAGYYDNDTAATDELLVKYLSQNKDAVLGDIISTIQKEQDQIIRQPPFQNIIVQGVAGSGKTTVAMHRISYILYNYEERFSPDRFCIIGNNDMLLNYITSGLPALDVYHVDQKRMDTFFRDLLGREWKKSYKIQPPSDSEAFKTRLNFLEELDRDLAGIRDRLLKGKDVTDHSLGVILSADSIARTLLENPDASIARLYGLLNQRIKARILFLMTESEPDKQKAKVKEYRTYFQLESALKNPLKLYQEFASSYGMRHGISVESLLAHVKKGTFDLYDMAALALIQKRMTEKEFHDEYGQIIIDEAQDFGPAVYYALRQILFGCYFTIMGDVSQNIYYHTGLNDWNALTQTVFAPDKTSFHILAKSYRNTIEISHVAGKVLDTASFGRYKIEPVIRHGAPVSFCQIPKEQMISKAADLISQIRLRGYDTIAVICRNQEDADYVRQNLEQYPHIFSAGPDKSFASPDTAEALTEQAIAFSKGVMVLPIHLTKGLEFDSVLLWNPVEDAYSLKEGEPNLLYVAITRALHELHILCCGKMTELLS
ncbi:MAG: ATP-binding domain-containing protein [Hungatella sp.]|nr:ATP-binding domain-containing protein [Hungatella sp.]